MNVDAHVHVWPPASNAAEDPAIAAAGATDALAATLRKAQINAVVLIQPAPLGLDHSYLLNALQGSHLRAVGIAQADPRDERSLDVITEVTRDVRIAGFRIPLLRTDNTWLRHHAEEFWSLAGARGKIVQLLVSPERLEAVEALAAAHPGVPVVVDHLARFDLADNRPGAIGQLCRLSSLPNIHVKASALSFLGHECRAAGDLWAHVLSVVDAFGADRVIWGSDYPFALGFEPYVHALRGVERFLRERCPEGTNCILGSNALRLFFEPLGMCR